MKFKIITSAIALSWLLQAGCKSSQTTTCDDPSSSDCPVKATTSNTASGPTNSPTAPVTSGAQIQLDLVSTAMLTFRWTPAKDDKTPISQLAYDLYISPPNPAFGTFDEVAEVISGTKISGGVNLTTVSFVPTIYMVSGNTYFVNVIVTDQNGERSVYKPRGDIYDSSVIFAWMFDGDTKDKTTSLNHLNYYDGIGSFLYTADRNGVSNAAGNFIVNSSAERSATIYASAPIIEPSLTAASPRTFSYWLKPKSNPVNANMPSQVVFMYGSDGINPSPQAFGMTIADQEFKFYSGDSYSNFLDNISGEWTHWILSFDGGYVHVYKNGSTLFSLLLNLDTPSGTKLVIGGADTPFPNNASHFYDGAIDDFEVFGRSLSVTDAFNLYNAQRAQL